MVFRKYLHLGCDIELNIEHNIQLYNNLL